MCRLGFAKGCFGLVRRRGGMDCSPGFLDLAHVTAKVSVPRGIGDNIRYARRGQMRECAFIFVSPCVMRAHRRRSIGSHNCIALQS
jgi:hypothetical protein